MTAEASAKTASTAANTAYLAAKLAAETYKTARIDTLYTTLGTAPGWTLTGTIGTGTVTTTAYPKTFTIAAKVVTTVPAYTLAGTEVASAGTKLVKSFYDAKKLSFDYFNDITGNKLGYSTWNTWKGGSENGGKLIAAEEGWRKLVSAVTSEDTHYLTAANALVFTKFTAGATGGKKCKKDNGTTLTKSAVTKLADSTSFTGTTTNDKLLECIRECAKLKPWITDAKASPAHDANDVTDASSNIYCTGIEWVGTNGSEKCTGFTKTAI